MSIDHASKIENDVDHERSVKEAEETRCMPSSVFQVMGRKTAAKIR
jgi:hypothetical protein